jgi:acyl-CoA reductase-like NAD-dependent aldehyde dehydrogenase
MSHASAAPNQAHPLHQSLSEMRALAGTVRPGYQARRRLFSSVADRLLERRPELSQLTSAPGFAFLASFLRPEHLDELIAAELSPDALTGFVSIGARRELRLVPRGVVCHWVAGNVPLLGMFSWAISALLGNVNVVRVSSRQDDLLTPLLREIGSISDDGRALMQETLVLQFDRDDTASHAAMSAVADVRIAWGGRDAVESVIGLPSEWDCDTIVLGPRVSIAAIDPAHVNTKILSRLASDIVYFDQQACSSPQFVFVKGRAGEQGFEDAVAALSVAVAENVRRFPRHALDFGETYRIALDRARVAITGGVLRLDEGTQWTVAVVERPQPEVRCVNRFVQVVPFESIDEILPWVPRNVQSAIVALGPDDARDFTERAAHRGVCRFPSPGQGNFFETPWDGIALASRLVRWVVRGEQGQGTARDR